MKSQGMIQVRSLENENGVERIVIWRKDERGDRRIESMNEEFNDDDDPGTD